MYIVHVQGFQLWYWYSGRVGAVLFLKGTLNEYRQSGKGRVGVKGFSTGEGPGIRRPVEHNFIRVVIGLVFEDRQNTTSLES